MNDYILDANEEVLEKELQGLMKEFWRTYKEKEDTEEEVENINN